MHGGRRALFAANWKMNLLSSDIEDFLDDIIPVARESAAELVLFPTSVYLQKVARLTEGTEVKFGAQNIFWERCGAYTGEISAEMAADCGAKYILCGHSERRHIFSESAEMVTRKARAAQASGLIPLICVGETLAEREAGETLETLRNDIFCSLAAVGASADLVIAYEPVWAIGTGQVATPEDAETAIAYIRELIRELWGDLADEIRILYGGSVKPENISDLMACPNIDGALIGGASLDADSFAAIIANGENC
ncbi:MAG: triose-phosphate isomerase [Bacillota bacterium]|nr:triose-phosphate isomerase [Bacillota bacterium]